MTAYYNEFDPYAATWVRNLINAGLIAPGIVDERSIEDVRPDDLDGFTQCHFFAGIAGWSLALRTAGWPDHRPVWTASCPCQPYSAAGKGAGFDDERHLWSHFYHLVREQKRRPEFIFGEQVASKLAEPWVDLVHADMEALDYAFGCIPFPAASVGAQHIRDRLYWLAHSERYKQPWEKSCGGTSGRVGRVEQSVSWDTDWQSALAKFRIMDYGIPRQVGATDAARNAIVPPQAAIFIQSAMSVLD